MIVSFITADGRVVSARGTNLICIMQDNGDCFNGICSPNETRREVSPDENCFIKDDRDLLLSPGLAHMVDRGRLTDRFTFRSLWHCSYFSGKSRTSEAFNKKIFNSSGGNIELKSG